MTFLLKYTGTWNSKVGKTRVFIADGLRVPYLLWKACWLDRLLNRWVQIYRNGELIFNWPARELKCPEEVIEPSDPF